MFCVRLVGSLAVALSVAACAPSPRYVYMPPATPQGLACIVQQCGQIRAFCRMSCDDSRRDCHLRAPAVAGFRTERRRPGLRPGPAPEDFQSGREASCATETQCEEGCDKIYNGCYSGCGGAVTLPPR